MRRLLPCLLLAASALAEPALLTSRRLSGAMSDLEEYDLWLLSPTRGDRQLTRWEGPEGEPAWCPARGLVYFTARRDGAWRLHQVGLDGEAPLPVGEPHPGQEGKPTVSPGGRYLAFPHLAPGAARWELVRLDLGTGERRTLLALPDGSVVQPEWSPAGDRLAFVTDRTGDLEIGLLTLATGAIEWVTDAPTADREPDFSPDGRSLVYTARKGGSADLFLYEIETRRHTRLTRLGAFSREASFEPDGRGIVFVSHFEGPGEIYRLDLGTGAITRLTRDGAADANPRRILVPGTGAD